MYYRSDISDGSLGYKQLAAQSNIPYSVRKSDDEDMLCIVRERAALEGSIEEGLEAEQMQPLGFNSGLV